VLRGEFVKEVLGEDWEDEDLLGEDEDLLDEDFLDDEEDLWEEDETL